MDGQSDSGGDGRRMTLMALLALWAAAWGWSLVQLVAEPSAGGTVDDIDQVNAFLGWQAIAGMLALALWGTGRGFPRQSGARRISGIPMGMALALMMALGGTWLWAALGA